MRDDATSVASSAADAAAAGTSAVACDAVAARLSPARLTRARCAAADQSTRPPSAARDAELPPRADVRSGTHRRERSAQQVAARAALLARQRSRNARLVLAPQLARSVHHRARCDEKHKQAGASAHGAARAALQPQRGAWARTKAVVFGGHRRAQEGRNQAARRVTRGRARRARHSAHLQSCSHLRSGCRVRLWRLLTSRPTARTCGQDAQPVPKACKLAVGRRRSGVRCCEARTSGDKRAASDAQHHRAARNQPRGLRLCHRA